MALPLPKRQHYENANDAGSSATAPICRPDLDAILHSVKDEMVASARKAVADAIRKYDVATNARFAAIETTVGVHEGKLDELHRELEKQKALVAKLAARLDLAESSTALPAHQIDKFDDKRDPDTSIAVVRSSESSTKEEILQIVKTIADALQLPFCNFGLRGREVGKRFTLHFKSGTPGDCIIRMARVFAYIKNGGDWREFSTAAGHQVFFDKDKSPFQERLEMAGRRLIKVAKSAYPHHSWHLDRNQGILSSNFKAVAKVVSEDLDDYQVRYNHEQVAALQIDPEALRQAFLASVSTRGADNTQWSV